MARNRKGECVIRSIKPGHPAPEGEPRRYIDGRGYVRLRWKVGKRQYVETYEHRLFDGVVTKAEHVHHLNKVRSDNRRENLQELTLMEHSEAHRHDREAKWHPFKCQMHAERAAHAENNRRDRAKRTELIRAMLAEGLTTIEVGKRVGLDPSGVSRYARLGCNP